jgi:hypothetical protein
MKRCPVAAHTERIRAAGGKRTSVDLTPAALVHLQALQRSTGNSQSAIICAALALAAACNPEKPQC